MKAETLIEMMLSGQYNTLTVSEFGAICRETIRAEEAKLEIEEEPLSNCCCATLVENTDLCSECKEHCGTTFEDMWDEAEYDKASSNKGELI